MKKIYYTGIIIGLLVSYFKLSQTPNLAQETVAMTDAQKAPLTEAGELKCYDYPRYYIITRPTDAVGTDILVKYKSNNQTFSCQYTLRTGDYEIKNQDAEYFMGVSNNLVFIDSGTGTDGRQLFIYDLNQRKKVFSSDYYEPIKLEGKDKNTLTFWKEVAQANRQNCPKYDEYKNLVGGAAIEALFKVNLRTFELVKTEQMRCNARQ